MKNPKIACADRFDAARPLQMFQRFTAQFVFGQRFALLTVSTSSCPSSALNTPRPSGTLVKSHERQGENRKCRREKTERSDGQAAGAAMPPFLTDVKMDMILNILLGVTCSETPYPPQTRCPLRGALSSQFPLRAPNAAACPCFFPIPGSGTFERRRGTRSTYDCSERRT